MTRETATKRRGHPAWDSGGYSDPVPSGSQGLLQIQSGFRWDGQTFPVPTSPLARRSHPKTSKESAAILRGSKRLGDLQAEALQWVRRRPGSTTYELATAAGYADERILGRRLSELKAVSYAHTEGSKRDPRTGRRCQLWWAGKAPTRRAL